MFRVIGLVCCLAFLHASHLSAEADGASPVSLSNAQQLDPGEEMTAAEIAQAEALTKQIGTKISFKSLDQAQRRLLDKNAIRFSLDGDDLASRVSALYTRATLAEDDHNYSRAAAFYKVIYDNSATILRDLGKLPPVDQQDIYDMATRRRAVEADYFPRAILDYGILVEKGMGVPRDYGLAIKLYALAGMGNYTAEERLGFMVYHGRGVPKDPQKAITIFSQSGIYSCPLAKLAEEGRLPDDRADVTEQMVQREAEICRQEQADIVASKSDTSLWWLIFAAGGGGTRSTQSSTSAFCFASFYAGAATLAGLTCQ